MALITCPECGKQVSSRAPACIHCGRPFDDLMKKVIRRTSDGEYVLEKEHITQQQAETYINSITSQPTYPYSFQFTSGSEYRIVLDDEPVDCVIDLKNVVHQIRGRYVCDASRLTPREATQYKEQLSQKQRQFNQHNKEIGIPHVALHFEYIIVDEDAPLKYVQKVAETRAPTNTPKCPHCGSTNISRISTASRLVSTSIFGLASNKIGKTMECKQCGYKW